MLKSFEELKIRPEIVDALKRINVVNPTDVQEQAIPPALEGKDIIVRAKTGTGKTFAFLLPILSNLKYNPHPEVLILAPTRELALQIDDNANKLAQHNARTAVVYGGASINMQIAKISHGSNIIIGTPGRILDLMDRGAVNFSHVKYLVLDEADIMLDMGFIDDVEKIITSTPMHKQTMLFSATVPEKLLGISKKYMNNAQYISVGEAEEVTVNTITHSYALVSHNQKFQTLLAYINEYKPKKAVIFVQTKHEANLVHEALAELGYKPTLLHGGLTQSRREHSLKNFRSFGRLLIATNVAARGLDIKDISDIINYDVPLEPAVYVHRVGRSARIGKNGKAFTIAVLDQRRMIEDIEYAANIKMEEIHLDSEKYKDDAIKTFARKKAHSRMRFGDRRQGQGHGGHFGGRGRGYGGSHGERNHNRSRREGASSGNNNNFEWYNRG